MAVLSDITGVSFTYPLMILAVDISSLSNKAFHYITTAQLSCLMQGCPLMNRKNQQFNIHYHKSTVRHTAGSESILVCSTNSCFLSRGFGSKTHTIAAILSTLSHCMWCGNSWADHWLEHAWLWLGYVLGTFKKDSQSHHRTSDVIEWLAGVQLSLLFLIHDSANTTLANAIFLLWWYYD